MKQIFRTYLGPSVYNVPLPTPGELEILVEVYRSVISTGTETMNMQRKNNTIAEKISEKKSLLIKINKYIKENGIGETFDAIKNKLNSTEFNELLQPIGYSNSGIVISKGNLVKNFNIGDRVACAGSGIAAHAQFTTIPINLAVKFPQSITFDHAAFTTIGAIAMQGIRRANISFGETIVISGLGLLGLLAVQIAKAWGLVVIGIDYNVQRLKLAEEFGADLTLKADDSNLLTTIQNITNGFGVDAVIIYAATKSSEPVNLGFKVCKRKGKVVAVGAVGMEINRDEMYAKELDFLISTSYGPGRYDDMYEIKGIDYPYGYVRWTENRNMQEFIRLLDKKLINVGKLISNTFSIEEVEAAYKCLIENPSENIGSVFKYRDLESESSDNFVQVDHKRIANSKIGVGIIGAGSFIQRTHLANMMSFSDRFNLVSVCNKTPVSSYQVQKKFKFVNATTNNEELFKNGDIDLIVIGTRHNLHASLVIKSLDAGKHILVEKPLAMNFNELEAIRSAVLRNSKLYLCVGFNRRYSPFVISALNELNKNKQPRVINYRINAGYFPPDIWIQKLDEGGGRIIGEVCHFIDLIIHLAESKVKSIGAISIPPEGEIHCEDNVIISILFENGSIGVATYASYGGKDMEKERIEIFSDKKSIVINDFKSLEFYNCNEKNQILKEPDKGHRTMIVELAKLLKGEQSLILPFDNDYLSTKFAIEVVEILQGNYNNTNSYN